MSIRHRKMKGLVMRFMRQNEVGTWKITRNRGTVGGKQLMQVWSSNKTWWCSIMDLESVEGLVWHFHPHQITQTTGHLVLMWTTPVMKGSHVPRLCSTDWVTVRGWRPWYCLEWLKQVESCMRVVWVVARRCEGLLKIKQSGTWGNGKKSESRV